MATKANRAYAGVQQYLEEAKGMIERGQAKKAKIKPLNIGGIVYAPLVPRKELPSKLQPAHTGPFRVVNKMSDVVIKVRNIGTRNIKAFHTDRVCYIIEDDVRPHFNPNVRRALSST